MRGVVQGIAGLIAIGAGLYLLSYGSGSINIAGQSGRSWFDIIDHGMGAYFCARGLWMLTQIGDLTPMKDALRRLVELREWEVGRRYEELTDEDHDEPLGAPQPAE